VPAGALAASAYGDGCAAVPQLVVNGVGPCSPPAAQIAVNGNVPCAGFLVAGFNGFCTEDQLKELLGRCAESLVGCVLGTV